jgi:hypothetical protein
MMSLNDIKYETVLKALNPPQIIYSTQTIYTMDASCHFAGCQELVPVDVKISSQYFEEIMDKINNFKRIDIIPVEFEGELYLLKVNYIY